MKWLSHLALWQPLTLAGHKNNILCSKWNHLWVNQCGWQTCSKCLIGPEAKPRLVWQEVVRLSVTCHPKKCLFSVTRPSRRRLPSPATLAEGVGGATTCCSPLITTEKSDSLDHQTAHISFIYQCDRFTPSPNPEAGCGRSGHETGQDAQKALTGDTWCSSIAPLC